MKILFLSCFALGSLLYADIAKESLVVSLLKVEKYNVYDCGVKSTKWYEKNTLKDDEIDAFCTEKYSNFDRNRNSVLFYNIKNFDVDYISKNLKFNFINSNQPIDYLLDKKDSLNRKSDETPQYLFNKSTGYTLSFKVNIVKPDGTQRTLNPLTTFETNSLPIIIDLDASNINLKTYKNTYNIDDVKECIDGKVWIKKYSSLSGDKCNWIER